LVAVASLGTTTITDATWSVFVPVASLTLIFDFVPTV
jgi:hypothetical protein